MIDIADVPRCYKNNVFYVNSRFHIIKSEGSKISEYDRKKNFISYEIEPEGNIIILK